MAVIWRKVVTKMKSARKKLRIWEESDQVSSHWQRVTWEKISEFGSQNHFQKSGIRNINLSLSNQTTAEDEEGKEEGERPEESIAEAKHDFEVLFAVV